MINIRKMTLQDVEQVLEIEKLCFGEKWNSTPFDKDLERDDCFYFIAEENDKVIGYCGCWIILEELHITTMAVKPNLQRRKLGQKLLVSLLKEGIDSKAKWATLEVKVTNIPAIRMYEKFGFSVMGRRKNYYQIDRQDAFVMWTDEMVTSEYQSLLNNIVEEK